MSVVTPVVLRVDPSSGSFLANSCATIQERGLHGCTHSMQVCIPSLACCTSKEDPSRNIAQLHIKLHGKSLSLPADRSQPLIWLAPFNKQNAKRQNLSDT